MIIWNTELYHSWGNSPKMKRLEKAYNAWYYKNHKEKWGVNTDKHGNTKVGSKKLSGKVIDLGPLKISRGKNGISANLDVTDVVGRKKTKSKTETKKEEAKKKTTKRKRKLTVSKSSKTSESSGKGTSKGKSGSSGKGKKGGSGKGKKGGSGKGKKKSAKKERTTTSTSKKQIADNYSYTHVYADGKLIKVNKKKVDVPTTSTPSKPKKSRRKKFKKTLTKKKSQITRKKVEKGKEKYKNRSKR